MLHTTMEIHESPEAFYSRTFLQLLRIPALKNLDFSQEDVHALEDCLRQALMNLPLPQALDFLHSQLLSSMCISPPVRKDNNQPAPFASPPLKRHFQWPPAHYWHILEKSMRPGTKKTDGDIENTYNWPLNWEMPNLTSDLCKGLSTYHPEIFQLLTSLGRRFIAKFLIVLLAADGHFLTLLISTLWSLRGGFTTLCLQGIFGSGKTYCASMMLVVATSILGIPTLLTAEPNLPLYTAADTICDLLREASEPTRCQYARLLAQNIPVSTSIDYGQEDRANLFQENSPFRCVIITQIGILRQLCHAYSPLSTFIKKVRLAFNDESQQGGKAGFTVIGANLPCSCLQCLTGDQEQTKAGSGGEKCRKLWSTNLRIRPSASSAAPNHIFPPPWYTPCSRLFAPLRPPTSLRIEILHLTSSNTFVTLACLSPVCLPLSGKLRAWYPPRVSLCISSSFHILSDVLRTLTSPRWPCIILIFSTPMAKLWPLVIMKIRSLTNLQPNSPPTSKTFPTIVRGIVFSIGLPACRRGATDFLQTMWSLSSRWLRRYLSTWLDRSAAIKKAPSCSSLLHNDTVEDILDAVGLPSDNLPPSLYEFYLVMIYKQQLLPTTISEFTRTDHAGKQFTPHLENVALQEIHAKISNDPTLHQDLERRATIETIVQIALDFPKGFSSYCTISNTVKAIGIGGVASVFVSCKISDFLTKTKEVPARNLVVLTRSKGLCVLLLPSTDKFITSSLHFLRTLCAFRHGMFSIGASPIDIPKLGTFITQSDVTHEDSPSIYTAETWQIAHQIAWYGTWHCLPLATAVSYAKHTFYFTLSLHTGLVPSSNVHQLEASAFEWKGSLSNHSSATISFAQKGLVLQA